MLFYAFFGTPRDPLSPPSYVQTESVARENWPNPFRSLFRKSSLAVLVKESERIPGMQLPSLSQADGSLETELREVTRAFSGPYRFPEIPPSTDWPSISHGFMQRARTCEQALDDGSSA